MNAAASRRAISAVSRTVDQTPYREALISEHLSLVSAIAAHIQRSLPVHIEIDDLIHAGMMGLLDAAVKYQPDKKVAFSTYAKHRIRGAILDCLRQLDWASRDLRKRYRQVETVKANLALSLGREPTEAEVASAMGLDARRWRALMVDFRSLGTASAPTRAESDSTLAKDLPCSSHNNPDQLFARSELREKLAEAMAILPARYRQVVELYYERDLTMKEIGFILGVNESRVSQIHKSALERMQMALDGSGIRSAQVF